MHTDLHFIPNSSSTYSSNRNSCEETDFFSPLPHPVSKEDPPLLSLARACWLMGKNTKVILTKSLLFFISGENKHGFELVLEGEERDRGAVPKGHKRREPLSFGATRTFL